MQTHNYILVEIAFTVRYLHHLFIFLFILSCVYTCVPVCGYVHSAHRGQSRALDPLQLELQVVVIHPTWVWGPSVGPLEELIVLLAAEPL